MLTHRHRGPACAALTALALGSVIGQAAVAADNPRSPDELLAVVESLHEPNVAWREIPWKTCLLEGLAESRRAKKPVLLWIFIDRPVDDERC